MRRALPGLTFFAALLLLPQGTAAQSSMFSEPSESELGFAAVVAVGDREVVVGEPTNRFRPGTVYVYRRDDSGEWTEGSRLVSSAADTRDRFGRSLALDGRTMLIGADSQRDSTPGIVYVFSRDLDGEWVEVMTLTSPDGGFEDGFGASVLLHDGLAFVGAPGHADNAGAVYVFSLEGGNWTSAQKLTSGDSSVAPGIGAVLAASGNHLLVGAPQADSSAGAVYHFYRDGESWVRTGRLQFPARAGERFGTTIVVEDDRAFVGAPAASQRSGGVVQFDLDVDENRWEPGPRLVPFDGTRRAAFGSALALTGDRLWVGVPGGRRTGGVVHTYSFDDAGWSGVSKILPGEEVSDRAFGNTLAARGDVAVVGITGSFNGAGNARVFERVDGRWIASTVLESPPESMEPITGERVNCEDGLAGQFDCNEVDLVSFLPVSAIGGVRGMRLNDLWGWTDEETGREFVIIGRSDGTSFVEMTDASNPRYLGDLPKTEGSNSAVWRDMKVYKNHAYIVADGAGEHGVQVVDLTQLREVDQPILVSEVFHYDGIASAHNIVVNEETGFAYVVGASGGGETCGGGLHMLDIRDPASPQFVGCFSDGVTGRRGTGYSHDAQCVIYHGPDEDYRGKEICIGANETALSFADVSDKDNPIAIANVSYPNVAYAHQGWFSDDQRYFFSNDEIDEANGSIPNTRTLVWDVEDLDDPTLVTEYLAPTTETDHNLYVQGDYMYQSNTGAGLRILDVSDPVNPVEVAFFDTAPDGPGGTWSNYPYFSSGVIPVTGGYSGIFFVRKRQNLVP